MFDYIIAGSGFAGCILAERIVNTDPNKKVLIIERRNHIGGNCYDRIDENGVLIHQYGPHLFHTDNKEVVDYLSNFTEWEVYHHEVIAMIDGKRVPIPFNLNTIYDVFPESLASKLEQKLLDTFDYNQKVPILELMKSEDKDIRFLAEFVYEKVFLHYTAKQWNKKPEEIDGAVTARVPIFVGKDNRYFNDKYQMLPKQGYTKIFDNMITHPNIKLMLNTDFNEIVKLEDGKFTLFGNPFDGKVIYTGKIDQLFDYKYGELPYKSVDMQFETIDKPLYQEKATVNYPNNYDFTRITEFKHMHPSDSKRTTILKEFPQDHIPGKNTPYYPVFTDETRLAHSKYEDLAKNIVQLILVGRLAEYKYYDMDDIVARSLEVFETTVKGDLL